MNTPKPSNKPKDQYPVRLRSPKDEDDIEFMFIGDEFSEILSILAEPDDETSLERVDQLLTNTLLLLLPFVSSTERWITSFTVPSSFTTSVTSRLAHSDMRKPK